MFQIPSLALRINPWRVGMGCGATRVERAALSPLPTRCQKKKNAFADTAPAESPRPPQHSAVCTIRFDIHSSGITLITSTCCSRIRGTGTSTICSICARPPVLSPDACTTVADDLTSNNLHDFLLNLWYWHIHDLLLDLQPDDAHSATAAASGRSGARCAPVMATIKCTMHTCQTLQHKLPRTAVKKKAMEWTTKTKSDGTHSNFRANPSDCSNTPAKERNKNFFAHTACK